MWCGTTRTTSRVTFHNPRSHCIQQPWVLCRISKTSRNIAFFDMTRLIRGLFLKSQLHRAKFQVVVRFFGGTASQFSFFYNSRTTDDQNKVGPVLDVPHLGEKKTSPNPTCLVPSSGCKSTKFYFVTHHSQIFRKNGLTRVSNIRPRHPLVLEGFLVRCIRITTDWSTITFGHGGPYSVTNFLAVLHSKLIQLI